MEPVTELIGVYHAEGTLRGELTYWLRARLGGGHCALCDITHGTVREKGDWQRCRTRLAVPFTTYHLDDRPPDVRDASEGGTPCVLARSASGLHLLVDAPALTSCEGDPERLVEVLADAAARERLQLG